jgi:hypothetical protein
VPPLKGAIIPPLLKDLAPGLTGTTVDCRIQKLDETGATLELKTPADIPAVFELTVAESARVYRCHVLWRLKARVGVVFG